MGGIPVFIDPGQLYADKEHQAVRRLFGPELVEMTIDNLIDSEAAYAGRTPRLDMIARLNRDYDNGHLVIIYTARLGCDRTVTEDWLRRHGVRYHSLITNKLPFDRLYDDHTAVMA